jgi:hypothetical protein
MHRLAFWRRGKSLGTWACAFLCRSHVYIQPWFSLHIDIRLQPCSHHLWGSFRKTCSAIKNTCNSLGHEGLRLRTFFHMQSSSYAFSVLSTVKILRWSFDIQRDWNTLYVFGEIHRSCHQYVQVSLSTIDAIRATFELLPRHELVEVPISILETCVRV